MLMVFNYSPLSLEISTLKYYAISIGREVAITCIHVGVDLPRVELALTSTDFNADVLYWKQKFPNKIIVAGMFDYGVIKH